MTRTEFSPVRHQSSTYMQNPPILTTSTPICGARAIFIKPGMDFILSIME